MDTNNTIPKQNDQPIIPPKTGSDPQIPEASIPATTPVTPNPQLQETQDQYKGVLNNYGEEINPPIQTTPVTPPITPSPQTPAPDYANPEVAQKKLEEILNTPTSQPPIENSVPVGPPVDTSPKNSIFRVLFLVSLFLFLGVSAVIAYFFIKGPVADPTPPVVVPVVTETPIVEPTIATPVNVCNVNGNTYKVSETFAAADGCNICSCAIDLSITCTQRVCTSTPSATAVPTKISTPSAITPTKAATATPTKAL